jgi:hypothetical protein
VNRPPPGSAGLAFSICRFKNRAGILPRVASPPVEIGFLPRLESVFYEVKHD